MENVQEQNNELRELNTPFGKLYIEPWEWHLNNKFSYDSPDHITIYDSHKDYLDRYPLDYFDVEERSAEEEYEEFCHMLELGAEKETIYDFMDWLGVMMIYAGDNKEEAADALSDGCPDELLPNELETNEYVNHVGDNYIVVSDV